VLWIVRVITDVFVCSIEIFGDTGSTKVIDVEGNCPISNSFVPSER